MLSTLVLVLAGLAVHGQPVDPVAALSAQLDAATRSWDSAAASEVLNHSRELDGDAARRLQVEAGLALAEILRVEFEQTPAGEREQRRTLGLRIDVAAEEALSALDGLAETSERERMRADLIATMIRSDFRARRYRDELQAAIDRALELDTDNPRALVTAAKPLVFAPPDQGRDLAAATERLDRALELAPGLESALLLRAEAEERAGDDAAARRDWQRALSANPDCLPAQRALASSGGAGP